MVRSMECARSVANRTFSRLSQDMHPPDVLLVFAHRLAAWTGPTNTRARRATPAWRPSGACGSRHCQRSSCCTSRGTVSWMRVRACVRLNMRVFGWVNALLHVFCPAGLRHSPVPEPSALNSAEVKRRCAISRVVFVCACVRECVCVFLFVCFVCAFADVCVRLEHEPHIQPWRTQPHQVFVWGDGVHLWRQQDMRGVAVPSHHLRGRVVRGRLREPRRSVRYASIDCCLSFFLSVLFLFHTAVLTLSASWLPPCVHHSFCPGRSVRAPSSVSLEKT